MQRIPSADVDHLLRLLPRTVSEEEVRHALAFRDWHRVLSAAPKNRRDAEAAGDELVEPPGYISSGSSHRWDAFQAIIPYLDDLEYWVLLGRVWTECEKKVDLYGGLSLFEPASHDRNLRRHLMDDLERRVFDSLPDTVQIWRGGRRGGWSWTMHRRLAENFRATEDSVEMLDPGGDAISDEPDDPDDKTGLHVGVCNKMDVIAIFLRKGEAEVIVNWTKVR